MPVVAVRERPCAAAVFQAGAFVSRDDMPRAEPIFTTSRKERHRRPEGENANELWGRVQPASKK